MDEVCSRSRGDYKELLFMLPRLFFLVVETLIDNQLTIRSRIVSLYKAMRIALRNQFKRR